MPDSLDDRITRGLALLTAHLERDPESGRIDERAFRLYLGDFVSDDDMLLALIDMLQAAELVMLTYQVKTDIRPVEVIREIALHRENRRGTAGE